LSSFGWDDGRFAASFGLEFSTREGLFFTGAASDAMRFKVCI
jgi:hypothetical protein